MNKLFVLGLVLLAVSVVFSGCAGTSSKASMEPAAAATSSANTSFDGRWTGSTEVEGYGSIPLGYDFKAEGNKLTGTTDTQAGKTPITNGKIKGNKITFNVTINLNGQDIVVNYTGILAGSELKLSWPGMGGVTEVTCTRG